MNRRQLLKSGGLALAGLSAPALLRAESPIVDIAMRSDIDGANVWFDPIGIVVEPGTIIRWTIHENVHTATAYHPDNDNHSLRIPKQAEPWDSGFLINPGDQFKVRLSVPGTYDYYCAPHEEGGMVGRIIVGKPGGPGELPFDYFSNLAPAPGWEEVPEQAQMNFRSIQAVP